MEFSFRAGDRRPGRPSSARLPPPFHPELETLLDPSIPVSGSHRSPAAGLPFEWEAAARRERIVRDEVHRRLIEKEWLIEAEVRRELALARAWFHGGLSPGPFVRRPYGPFVPDSPFMPPMPPPPMPAGMHTSWPPPAPLGSWEGFDPRRRSGFAQPMLHSEARWSPLPPPKPKHKLELRESSEVISSEPKASGVKRKVDAISAATEPIEPQNVTSATTEPTNLQNAARDWSCALCQVSTTSEAGLNQHLQGKKHKAKLVQCGAIKVTDVHKSGLQLQATTRNDNGAGPSGVPKKIHILVDGALQEVIQKTNYVWCERCRVRCTNAAAMADHLRGKKHSLLNKVWTSIKSVRMNKKNKEDWVSACEREVNENGPTGILDDNKKEDTHITSEFSGDGSFEIPVEMKKETAGIAEGANENGHILIAVDIEKEGTDIASKVHNNGPVEIKQQGTDVVLDVNKNFFTESPAEIKKEGKEMAREIKGNSSTEIPAGIK